jgi:capsular polysaccharide biosynthesis protein
MMLQQLKRSVKRLSVRFISLFPGKRTGFFFVNGFTTLDNETKKNSSLFNVHSPVPIDRCEAIAIDGQKHWKFEPGAAGITNISNGTYSGKVTNAFVVGDNAAVISSSNRLLTDVSPEIGQPYNRHSTLQILSRDKPHVLPGKTFLLAGSEGKDNYFHWMTDVLPKIEIAASTLTNSGAVNVVTNSVCKEYQKLTLQHLGFKFDNIIPLDKYNFIKCQELIVASPTCLSGNVPLWIVQFLRKAFSSWMVADSSKPDKIFISRAKSTKRRLSNENELWSLLSKKGFKKVYLEDMSLQDQVGTFYNASWIMGVHGAGFTNLCFSKAGAQIIEIFSPSYVNQCFWTIASQVGLEYKYLVGNGPDNTTNQNHLIDTDFMLSSNKIACIAKHLE